MNNAHALEELRVEHVSGMAETIIRLGRLMKPTGKADAQNYAIAKKTGLPLTLVEAYRGKKRKSVPTHLREYLECFLDAYNERQERQLAHENRELKRQLATLHTALTVGSSDPEFYSSAADGVRAQFSGLGADETAVGDPDRTVD